MMRASLLCSVAIAVTFASPAMAEGKRALVIAKGADDHAVSVEISETLLGLGFDVQRLEAPTDDDLTDAFARLQASSEPTVVYSTSVNVSIRDYLEDAPSAPRLFFADICADFSDFDAPENSYLLTRSATCDAPLSDVLLDRLNVPGLKTDQWDLPTNFDVVSTLETPFVFRTATSNVRLTADDYAMLETLSPAARDRMVQLWRDAGIPVDVLNAASTDEVALATDTVSLTPIRPVVPAAVVSPVSPRLNGGVARVADSVSIVSRPVTSSLSQPLAGQDGLPQPSILVGYVVENLPDAPVVPNEPVSGTTFGIDDVSAREALREQDAAVFTGLVEQGAFDPPEADLERALQVELARINCYTAGIDGAWGPGSQRALLAFYEEIGEVPPGSQAGLDAFREVIARDDVRCPDPPPVQIAQPVTQPRAPQQTAAAQSRRVAPAPAPAPARVAPAQPAAPAGNRRSISQTGGTGVFR